MEKCRDLSECDRSRSMCDPYRTGSHWGQTLITGLISQSQLRRSTWEHFDSPIPDILGDLNVLLAVLSMRALIRTFYTEERSVSTYWSPSEAIMSHHVTPSSTLSWGARVVLSTLHLHLSVILHITSREINWSSSVMAECFHWHAWTRLSMEF